MFDLSTAQHKFTAAFTATYLILTIISIIAIYKSNPNIALARRCIHGLMILSAFAIGFMLAKHTGESKTQWDLQSIILALTSVVFVVLGMVVVIAVNKATPDIKSAKRALSGLGVLSLVLVFNVVMQKAPSFMQMKSF